MIAHNFLFCDVKLFRVHPCCKVQKLETKDDYMLFSDSFFSTFLSERIMKPNLRNVRSTNMSTASPFLLKRLNILMLDCFNNYRSFNIELGSGWICEKFETSK